jgi:hypothetical protein
VSIESILEREQEARDAALTETRCMFCAWTYYGTAMDGRERARKHREKKHPDAIQSSRVKVRGRGWRQPTLKGRDRDEIENERRKRMFLLGIAETE